MEKLLVRLLEKIDIEQNDEMKRAFLIYKDLLKEWNEKINLTAITDDEGIVIKHFIDSLTILKYINKGSKIIDVGTGAGFPGIPIKIADTTSDVTLMDALNKRINFLNEVISKNNLKNILTVHGRAEDLGKDIKYREKYDVSTARAVANMATLSELCLPFVKVGGCFICMKGNNIQEEIESSKNAIKILGGVIESVNKFYLPETDIERNIIIIRKEKSTPSKYPRKAPIPAKEPIM